MPAVALDVNWEAVRAHALTHGVRAAAEHYGIAPGTLTARSCREQWFKPLRDAQAAALAVPESMKPKAVNAVGPVQAAVNAVSGYSGKAKLGLAKAISKASTRLGRMKPEEILSRHDQVRSMTVSGKNVFTDWSADSPSLISIHIAPTQPTERPVIDISPENV